MGHTAPFDINQESVGRIVPWVNGPTADAQQDACLMEKKHVFNVSYFLFAFALLMAFQAWMGYRDYTQLSYSDMMRMVGDILALTELQAGKLYPRREPFSLRGLVDGLRAQYSPRATDKGLGFVVELEDSLPDTLEGDAGKLAQALGYLLDNAVKFSHQGQVTLRVQAAGPLSGSMPLRIEVLDTGIGFVAPEEGRLYQRFHQLDGSMTRQYGGLGVGLAICRQLVELLGGRLQHHSAPGQGSAFSVELELKLPVQRHDAVTGSRRVGGAPQRSPEQCTVLIVEDNPINQLVTRGMLLKLGYRVDARTRITLDVLNLFDRQANDIEYWGGACTRRETLTGSCGGGIDGRLVHPLEPRTFRLSLRARF